MKFDNIQPRRVVCRQSCMNCATACERKWFYCYRIGVTLRGVQIKEAATLGKIYHKFQQLGPGRESEVLSWVRGQQTTLMERADKGEDLDGSMVRLANLLTELYHKAEVMAHLFWERYPQPSYLRTIGTELEISYPYEDLVLEGTIDKLLVDTNTGDLWIRDHKSTGQGLEVIFGGFPWSIQARLYRVLADYYGSKESTKPIRGFIMDGILKPGIKLCRTDEKNAKGWNCSPQDAYLSRVKEWYKEKDEDAMLSKAIIFNEPLYPAEFVAALDMIRDLSKRPIDPAAFSRDITRMTCFQYRTKCIYHNLCETNPMQWDQLFETKYKIE